MSRRLLPTFDLQYDPLLLDRKWTHRIHLSDLNSDQIVAPLLKEWGIPDDQTDAELRKLLTLPQNLRLFEAVAKRVALIVISGRSRLPGSWIFAL